MNINEIPIIIPAYEPDERLVELARDIKKSEFENVIIVNDGSGEAYCHLYEEAQEIIGRDRCTVLIHEINRGKGRAIKTAFQYVLDNIPHTIGVITADSDGQHSVDCIRKVMEALAANPESLVLGVRQFDDKNVPWKSRIGNTITLKIFKMITGLDVQDTQTGLRGIPNAFIKELIDVDGERFEFEMKMLLESVGKYSIEQVTIKTIYDSKTDHQTHFNPFLDSIRIYGIMFHIFIKYIFSSLASFVVDIVLFYIFCKITKPINQDLYITYSTVFARVISSLFNYIINYKLVFSSTENKGKALLKYVLLAIIQMSLSSLFVTLLSKYVLIDYDVLAKIIVDTLLFFISYYVQKKFIFKHNK